MKIAAPIALLALFLCSAAAQAESPAPPFPSRKALVSGLTSSNWRERRQAFEAVSKELESDRPSKMSRAELQALEIDTLRRETVTVNRSEDAGEEYGEYFAGVVVEVASLRDPRALDALIEPTILETGGIAQNGLADLGDTAMDRIEREYKLAVDDPDRRFWLSAVAARMSQRQTLSSESARAKLRALILDAANSADWHTRIMAVRGLAYLKDAQSQAVLERIATSDPFGRKQFGETVYLVREEVSQIRARRAAGNR
jgi:hypothetical protein